MPDYWVAARSLSVAMLGFAAYLFLLWARKRSRRKDLALAALFVVMGLYDYSVSRVYAAVLPADSIPWLRLVSAADELAAAAFLWYLAEYTGVVRRRSLVLLSALFVILAALALGAPGDLAWVASRPLEFTFKLPFLPEVAFRQVRSGPLGILSAVAGLGFIGYCIRVVRRYAKGGHPVEVRGFAAVIVGVFLAILNDTLVGMGAYRFIFLTEYAWAAALVFLTWRSSQDTLLGAEAMEDLARSEARLRAMVENVPFNMWICDSEGRLILQNAADIAAVGDHVGETYSDWKGPKGNPTAFAEQGRRALGGEIVDQNLTYEVAGRKRTYREIIAPAVTNGAIIGTVGIGIDISEAEKIEEELRTRLAEKEALLRELHHRVKNNLQVIVSLVNIRVHALGDEASKAAFLAIQRQVHAIARVHESLYLSGNLATIEFGAYLRILVGELVAMNDGGGIETAFELDEVQLGIGTAIPVALIVNELVTNSLKHAFVGRPSGRLAVCLRKLAGPEALLAVEDDGPGIPGDDGAGGKVPTLGMVLVSSLSAQLGGRLVVCGPRRNRVELVFPVEAGA
jgi:PAS domain S-box-containing protein